MKLGASVCFFNDRASLQRCLDSITNGVDVIFCIDGRYPDFDYPTDLSDDGSRELVKSYLNSMLIDYSGPEPAKRNRYLQACQEYGIDYCLMIDSDEYILEADWPAFRTNCKRVCNDSTNVYGVNFRYTTTPPPDYTPYPRLWFKPYEMEYYQCHNIFRHKPSGNYYRSPATAPLIEGITLTGDDSLRSPDFIKKSYDYQVKLIEHEKPIKKSLL